MVSLMLERRHAPLDNTFHGIYPSLFTPRKRSKSFSYKTFDMEKGISTASFQESHALLSKQSSNQDQPLTVTGDAESGACVEESRKIASKAKVCMTATRESMDMEDPPSMSEELKSVESSSPTLPRLLGSIRAEISNACISTSDAQCVGNRVSIDTQSDLARACAQAAREAFLQRHRSIASRKIFAEKESLSNLHVMVEEKVDICSPKLHCATMQKHKPGCSTSPFPRLLGSVRMQMPNSHNMGDMRDMTFDAEPIANDGNVDTSDAVRPCAQIALEPYHAYQHRVINRNSLAVP